MHAPCASARDPFHQSLRFQLLASFPVFALPALSFLSRWHTGGQTRQDVPKTCPSPSGRRRPGDVLVFFTGQQEIEEAVLSIFLAAVFSSRQEGAKKEASLMIPVALKTMDQVFTLFFATENQVFDGL